MITHCAVSLALFAPQAVRGSTNKVFCKHTASLLHPHPPSLKHTPDLTLISLPINDPATSHTGYPHHTHAHATPTACGSSICDDCSDYTALPDLGYGRTGKERVCRLCMEGRQRKPSPSDAADGGNSNSSSRSNSRSNSTSGGGGGGGEFGGKGGDKKVRFCLYPFPTITLAQLPTHGPL